MYNMTNIIECMYVCAPTSAAKIVNARACEKRKLEIMTNLRSFASRELRANHGDSGESFNSLSMLLSRQEAASTNF